VEGTVAGQARVRVLEAFRHRDFRLIWLGQSVSLIGDGAFLTALGWRTFTLAGAGRLGVVLLCHGVAMLASILLGGVLADRYERRALMIASDLARFAVVGTLALVDGTGHLTFPILVVLATLMGLGDGFFHPAFGGIVPLVVAPASLGSANSLIGVARWSGFLFGPAIAAAIYGGAGSAAVFGIDAWTFVVSAALIFRARTRRVETAAEPAGTLSELREGARYVARVPWLWVSISVFALILMLQLAPQQILMPKLIAEHFHRGVASYGLLISTLGAGNVIGLLVFGQLQPRRRRGRIAYTLWVLNSLFIAGLALSPWYSLSLAFAVCRGFCLGFANGIWETVLMELVPERLLSRVISLDYFGTFGLMPIGLAIWAALANIAPPGPMIASGALASAVLTALVLTRPWLREVE
jgi:MFS family permease